MELQIFTDQVAKYFIDLDKMNFSNDDFIRTTEARHKKTASYFGKLEDSGYIYKDKYSGWYSVRDEAFIMKN